MDSNHLLQDILEQQKKQTFILDRLLNNVGVSIENTSRQITGVTDSGRLKGQEGFSLSYAQCDKPVSVLIFNRVIQGIAKCEIYEYERVKIVGGDDYQPEVVPFHHKHFDSNSFICNGTVDTGSTDIQTAYNNADSIDIQNKLGRLGVEGFILNASTTATLYVWFSYDGQKYYSTDPTAGVTVEYIPVLPKTQLSINPYLIKTLKIGANSNSSNYTVVIS